MANNFFPSRTHGEERAPVSQGEAADAIRRHLPPIDIEPDGTKANCRKDPQPGFTIARSEEPV